jgi:hypothetical protein
VGRGHTVRRVARQNPLILVLALVSAIGAGGCGFSVSVVPAHRLVDGPERTTGVEPRIPENLLFHCYYPTIWGRFSDASEACEEVKGVSRQMLRDAFRHPESGTETAHEDVLEMSVEEQWHPSPLSFLRGLGSFVSEMFSPITITERAEWTLEVRSTSAAGTLTQRKYETVAYKTGGALLSLVSVPAPPSNARRVVHTLKASHTTWATKIESVRSLVAGYIVDVRPQVCDGMSCAGCTNKPWEPEWRAASAECLDCQALLAACHP